MSFGFCIVSLVSFLYDRYFRILYCLVPFWFDLDIMIISFKLSGFTFVSFPHSLTSQLPGSTNFRFGISVRLIGFHFPCDSIKITVHINHHKLFSFLSSGHTHTRARTHARTQTHTIHTHAHRQTETHTQTRTHARTHTHTHYTHTCSSSAHESLFSSIICSCFDLCMPTIRVTGTQINKHAESNTSTIRNKNWEKKMTCTRIRLLS